MVIFGFSFWYREKIPISKFPLLSYFYRKLYGTKNCQISLGSKDICCLELTKTIHKGDFAFLNHFYVQISCIVMIFMKYSGNWSDPSIQLNAFQIPVKFHLVRITKNDLTPLNKFLRFQKSTSSSTRISLKAQLVTLTGSIAYILLD